MLYPLHRPARGPGAAPGASACRPTSALDVVRAYVGERANRRHRPGRALERTGYRFDVLSDYGAFRDLQRHRMLTIEWQDLSPPARLHAARRRSPRPGLADRFDDADGSARPTCTTRWSRASRPRRPTPSRWPTGSATSCRSTPARRCTCSSCAPAPQGHPEYRRVCQEMHRLIAEQAGHQAGRRADALRRPRHLRPRTPRLRTPGRGPPPQHLTRSPHRFWRQRRTDSMGNCRQFLVGADAGLLLVRLMLTV